MTRTWAVGDPVRVRNTRGVFVIVDHALVRGEVRVFGGVKKCRGFRWVSTDLLMPPHKDDVAPSLRGVS